MTDADPGLHTSDTAGSLSGLAASRLLFTQTDWPAAQSAGQDRTIQDRQTDTTQRRREHKELLLSSGDGAGGGVVGGDRGGLESGQPLCRTVSLRAEKYINIYILGRHSQGIYITGAAREPVGERKTRTPRSALEAWQEDTPSVMCP